MNDVLSGVKHLLETRATPDNAHQTKNMHIFHTLHPTKRAKEKKPYSGPFLNAILRGGISQVVSATFRNHLQTDWNSLTANQKPLFQWFYGKLHEKISQKRPSFLVCQFVWVTWVFRRMCWTYYQGDKFWLNLFCHRSNKLSVKQNSGTENYQVKYCTMENSGTESQFFRAFENFSWKFQDFILIRAENSRIFYSTQF